eukprot:139335-Prorocentrum_minimum.AAC.4
MLLSFFTGKPVAAPRLLPQRKRPRRKSPINMSASASDISADLLSQKLGLKVASMKERRLQSLWAGYGSVSSLTAQLEDGATKRFIVKKVDPPRVSGGSIGDARKLRSYAVETFFYQQLAEKLIHHGTAVATPLHLHKEVRGGGRGGVRGGVSGPQRCVIRHRGGIRGGVRVGVRGGVRGG